MTGARRQTLAHLAASQAPLRPRRAAAIMLAVVDEVLHTPHRFALSALGSDRVELDEHGAIHMATIDPGGTGPSVGSDSSGWEPDQLGADVGKLFFLLLVGRPPRGSEDAFEPHLRSALNDELVSLVARSCADSPGQWPDAADWRAPLERFAGSASPGPPPHRLRARRRRSLVLAIAMAALIAVTLVVLLLTPRWWDQATSDEGLGRDSSTPSGSAVQRLATS
ncbi:MAG: hypothetical protein V9E94_19615 [Microthrixaceae bacterium]